MPSYPPDTPWSSPMAQVGALLALDTRLATVGDLYQGNKHWKLVGSCVLVGWQAVLTIRHIFEVTQEKLAAFFPYEGFFEVTKAVRTPGEALWGDHLILLWLENPMKFSSSLPYGKIFSNFKAIGRATVCGYGRWDGTPFHGLDGLQQRYEVELGRPPEWLPPWPLDPDSHPQMDLYWSAAANEGRVAGRYNSGGPMLWQDESGYTIIGINREAKGDQQIGSWINDQRQKHLGKALRLGPRGFSIMPRVARTLVIDAKEKGILIPIPIPDARRFRDRPSVKTIRATLNASDGIRLQMRIDPDPPDLDLLAGDDKDSGRFLYRQIELQRRADVIWVAIAPVAGAFLRAPRVLAQLCIHFEEEPYDEVQWAQRRLRASPPPAGQ